MEPDDGSAINFPRSAYWTYVAMNSGLMCPGVSITQFNEARKSSFVGPTCWTPGANLTEISLVSWIRGWYNSWPAALGPGPLRASSVIGSVKDWARSTVIDP